VKEPRSVYSSSPPLSLSSLILKKLVIVLTARRCVIVPHIGSATLETRLGMVSLAARNALAGIDEKAMPAELDVAARIAALL